MAFNLRRQFEIARITLAPRKRQHKRRDQERRLAPYSRRVSHATVWEEQVHALVR